MKEFKYDILTITYQYKIKIFIHSTDLPSEFSSLESLLDKY